MKTVQMDRLDFSDHFSYIICLIWSYRIKVMNFLKFKLYSGISYIRLNPENQLLRQPDVSVTSAGQLRLAEVKPDVWGPHVSDRGGLTGLN